MAIQDWQSWESSQGGGNPTPTPSIPAPSGNGFNNFLNEAGTEAGRFIGTNPSPSGGLLGTVSGFGRLLALPFSSVIGSIQNRDPGYSLPMWKSLASSIPGALHQVGQSMANTFGGGQLTGPLLRPILKSAGFEPTMTPMQQLAQDPFGTTLNLTTLLGGAGSAARLGGRIAARTGAVDTADTLANAAAGAGRAASYTNPLSVAGKAVGTTVGRIPIPRGTPFQGATVGDLFSKYGGVGPEVAGPIKEAEGTSNLNKEVTIPRFAESQIGKYPSSVMTPEVGKEVVNQLGSKPSEVLPPEDQLHIPGTEPEPVPGSGGSVVPYNPAVSKIVSDYRTQYNQSLRELADAGAPQSVIDNYVNRDYQEYYPKSESNPYGYTGKTPPQRDLSTNAYLAQHPEVFGAPTQGLEKARSISDSFFQRLLNDPATADEAKLHPITDPRLLSTIYEGQKQSILNMANLTKALQQVPATADRNTEVGNVPELNGLKFTPKEADLISSIYQANSSPAGWTDVMGKIFDPVNGIAKFSMFGNPLSVGYHLANITERASQFLSATPFNPLNFPKFANLYQDLVQKGPAFQQALTGGAFGSEARGMFGVKDKLASDSFQEVLAKEGQTLPGQIIDGLKKQIPSISNVRGGETISQKILWTYDRILRMAIQQSGIAKGMTPEEAGQMTAKAMVDYGNLTPFEKQIMTRAFFFYPWMKGSLQSVVDGLSQHPIYYQGLSGASSDQNPTLRDQGEFQLNPNDANSPVMGVSTPLKSAAELATNPTAFGLSRISPALRTFSTVPLSLAGKYVNPKLGGILPQFGDIGTKPKTVIPAVGNLPSVALNPILEEILSTYLPSLTAAQRFSGSPKIDLGTILGQLGFYNKPSLPQQNKSAASQASFNRRDQRTQQRSLERSLSGYREFFPGIYSK